jgi:hypothetical protein
MPQKNNGAKLLETSQDPTIYNVTMTNANTEYSQVLPDNCKAFAVSVQGAASTDNFRLAFVTGKVATPTAPYLKYPGDAEYGKEGVNLVGKTVYAACSAAGKVLQIEAWL